MITRTKARWMSKLAKAKSFIIVTDTEAAFNLSMDNSKNLMDLVHKRSSLERFRMTLSEAIRELDKEIVGQTKPRNGSKRKGKKIEVKQG